VLDWLKGKIASNRLHPLHETLFGDVPLAQWAGNAATEPWRSFDHAAASIDRQDRGAAIQAFEGILTQSDLESRHYLQAWTSLRQLGIQAPGSQAKHLYGIVLDLPVSGGLDTLAAYEDRGARYFNFSGKAVIWDRPNPSLDGEIEGLLAASRELLGKIGPWEGVRPPLPHGLARISLLTPSGLHFGEAAPALLFRDPMAAPVLQAATRLMQALIARTSTA